MDVSSYIQSWRDRAEQDERATARAQRAARAALPRVVEVLQKAGATRAWLIGSLARGTFRPGSDLDFMVEGLDDRAAWQAGAAAAQAVGLGVDVLPVESLSPHWRAYHERSGEVVLG